MLEITTKLFALLNAMEPADLDTLPPARRRRLADMLRHWAALAEPRPAPKPRPAPGGVLRDLQEGRPE